MNQSAQASLLPENIWETKQTAGFDLCCKKIYNADTWLYSVLSGQFYWD